MKETKVVERMTPAEDRWLDHWRNCGHCFNDERCPFGAVLYKLYLCDKKRGA